MGAGYILKLLFDQPTLIYAVPMPSANGRGTLNFLIEVNSVIVDAKGINMVLDDNWPVWKGRGLKKKQIGTEFVIRENIARKKRRIKKGPLKGTTQFYKVTRRVFRKDAK